MENKITLVLSEKQMQNLKEVFRCAVAISIAAPDDNHSSCGSFHIKPFNTHWHEDTVAEVAKNVHLYVKSWIVAPMEEIFGFNMTEENDIMMMRWHEKQFEILRNKLTKK